MFKAVGELETRLADAPAGWRDDPDYSEATYAAKVARQGLFEFDHEYKGADKKFDEAEYYSRRDVFMAANLVERIGDGRAALWAHDNHVASAFSAADEQAGWRNLGWSIKAKLQGGYQTVGFTWSRATLNVVSLSDAARNPSVETRVYSDVPLRNDRPGELGHLFSALPGDAWWIDMRTRPHSAALDRWAARPAWRGWAGWRVDPANWQKKNDGGAQPPDRGFDVIVWFRKMTPARVWPGR